MSVTLYQSSTRPHRPEEQWSWDDFERLMRSSSGSDHLTAVQRLKRRVQQDPRSIQLGLDDDTIQRRLEEAAARHSETLGPMTLDPSNSRHSGRSRQDGSTGPYHSSMSLLADGCDTTHLRLMVDALGEPRRSAGSAVVVTAPMMAVSPHESETVEVREQLLLAMSEMPPQCYFGAPPEFYTDLVANCVALLRKSLDTAPLQSMADNVTDLDVGGFRAVEGTSVYEDHAQVDALWHRIRSLSVLCLRRVCLLSPPHMEHIVRLTLQGRISLRRATDSRRLPTPLTSARLGAASPVGRRDRYQTMSMSDMDLTAAELPVLLHSLRQEEDYRVPAMSLLVVLAEHGFRRRGLVAPAVAEPRQLSPSDVGIVFRELLHFARDGDVAVCVRILTLDAMRHFLLTSGEMLAESGHHVVQCYSVLSPLVRNTEVVDMLIIAGLHCLTALIRAAVDFAADAPKQSSFCKCLRPGATEGYEWLIHGFCEQGWGENVLAAACKHRNGTVEAALEVNAELAGLARVTESPLLSRQVLRLAGRFLPPGDVQPWLSWVPSRMAGDIKEGTRLETRRGDASKVTRPMEALALDAVARLAKPSAIGQLETVLYQPLPFQDITPMLRAAATLVALHPATPEATAAVTDVFVPCLAQVDAKIAGNSVASLQAWVARTTVGDTFYRRLVDAIVPQNVMSINRPEFAVAVMELAIATIRAAKDPAVRAMGALVPPLLDILSSGDLFRRRTEAVTNTALRLLAVIGACPHMAHGEIVKAALDRYVGLRSEDQGLLYAATNQGVPDCMRLLTLSAAVATVVGAMHPNAAASLLEARGQYPEAERMYADLCSTAATLRGLPSSRNPLRDTVHAVVDWRCPERRAARVRATRAVLEVLDVNAVAMLSRLSEYHAVPQWSPSWAVIPRRALAAVVPYLPGSEALFGFAAHTAAHTSVDGTGETLRWMLRVALLRRGSVGATWGTRRLVLRRELQALDLQHGVRRFVGLTSLTLDRCAAVDKDVLQWVRPLAQLRELRLLFCDNLLSLNVPAAKHKLLPLLEVLSLRGCPISDSDLSVLTVLTPGSLDIAECSRLTAACLRLLQQWSRSLRRLHVGQGPAGTAPEHFALPWLRLEHVACHPPLSEGTVNAVVRQSRLPPGSATPLVITPLAVPLPPIHTTVPGPHLQANPAAAAPVVPRPPAHLQPQPAVSLPMHVPQGAFAQPTMSTESPALPMSGGDAVNSYFL